ncbi:hypothetical protein BJ742DRAFT_484744 [Cladochytrium replicatum]|nr:hypothetical protein BJ742DRAFT_484744 [Cladochytrium replicatum]
MVVMPLMYPEIFANFKIKPPRGVLFYGPPGTGKTLMARALAGSCSTNQQRVAFFMRKGADVMSKWVGESERQLRLLFDQARAFQPSIIFFDEIDGLAPVRSSKQDQVHASIVSTLLALMDGLDSRGQVVVIGATNRIDAIDPALRRPGRFDREFYFPLPSEAARKQIIDIATQEWKPPLDDDLKLHLAKETRNYCGADVKALCTEAALNAVRRTYPQIYFSENKLLLDVGSIEVRTEDFSRALHAIVPNSNRTSVARSQPIPSHIAPLLKSNNKALQSALDQIVPTMKLLAKKLANVTSQSSGNPEIKSGASSSSLASLASGESYTEAQGSSNTFLSYFKTFQPRILIAGEPGMGQKYLGPAALAQLENHKFHITALDLASLHGDSTKTPEATVVQAFGEARRHRLSVIYVPHADQWWMNTSEVAKSNFQNLLAMEPRQQPILLLATSETPVENMSGKFRKVFLEEGLGIGTMEPGLVALTLPNDSERRAFFEPLLADIRHPSIVANKAGTFAIDDAPTLVQKSADMPELPLAPPPPPHKLTPQELEAVRQSDDVLLAQLRKELRAIMSNLKGYRTMFRTPWFEQNYPEYFDEGQHALTLDVIDEKIDVHYLTPEEWYDDVKTMTDEIAHLFPHRLASKAHALRDEVFLTRNSFTDEFRYDCKMMSIRRREARKKEAEHRRKAEEENAIQVDEGSTVRSSRRLRGEEPVIVEPNEDVVEIEDDDERLCISRSKGKAPAMSATPDATTGADECILQAVGVEEGRLKSPHDFDENFFIPPTTERAEVADQISEMEIDDEPPKEIIPSSSPVHRAEIEVRQAVASEANQADAAIVSETVVIGGPSVAVEDSDKSSAPEPVSLEPELTFVIEEEEVQAFADILVQRTTGLGLGEVEAVAVTLASLLTRMTRVEQRAHVVRELQAELQRMCARS